MMQASDFLHEDQERAEALYLEALALEPDNAVAWFDLGLIYKWSRRWEKSFDCNLRAAEIIGEKADEPAWWNLGIAATALHRWDVARRAWRAYGIAIPDGAGPIEGEFGIGVVRLNPETDGETVWGLRIDPARMRLISIPFAESGHRWSDVVLHDGSPAGQRESNGHTYTVFDEIHRWAPSDTPTMQATVTASTEEAIDDLIESIERAGFVAEDWTRNVRVICSACSEGHIHEDHDPQPAVPDGEHVVGIAGPADAVRSIVAEWANTTDRICSSLEVVA